MYSADVIHTKAVASACSCVCACVWMRRDSALLTDCSNQYGGDGWDFFPLKELDF